MDGCSPDLERREGEELEAGGTFEVVGGDDDGPLVPAASVVSSSSLTVSGRLSRREFVFLRARPFKGSVEVVGEVPGDPDAAVAAAAFAAVRYAFEFDLLFSRGGASSPSVFSGVEGSVGGKLPMKCVAWAFETIVVLPGGQGVMCNSKRWVSMQKSNGLPSQQDTHFEANAVRPWKKKKSDGAK